MSDLIDRQAAIDALALDEFEGHAVIALKTPRYCGALMRRHT